MATPLPSPLAAALGIVPAVLDGVRSLPGRAVRLPVLAVSNALNTADLLRREYDGLAERGERLVARLRGETLERADDLEDRVEDLVARTPLRGVRDRVEDAVDRLADADPAPTSPATPAEVPPGPAAGFAPTPDAEAPKGVPTPRAVEPDTGRVDTAASPSVVEAVEQAVSRVAATPVAHDDLPLPDYDHMTLGSLRGRLRALSVEQLAQVRAYEKGHADRLPVVTMLDNRIAKLSTDPAAGPSGPASVEPAPPR